MALITKKFRKSGEGAIASFPYSDIAEGTGLTLFYGAKIDYNFASSAILTTAQVFSTAVETVKYNPEGAWSSKIELNFDSVPLNLPKIMKGTAFVSVPTYYDRAVGNLSYYPYVEIHKINGANDTLIGSASGSIITCTADTERIVCLKVPCTTTYFNSTDQIRLKVQIWAVDEGDDNGYLYLGHDPQNRDGAKITTNTQLIFYAPFKIDT